MMSALRWFVFAVAAIGLNFPVLVTLSTSFKSARELSGNPGLWVQAPTFENYRAVFEVSDRLNAAICPSSMSTSSSVSTHSRFTGAQ